MFDQSNSQFEITLTPKNHHHRANEYLDDTSNIYEELLLNHFFDEDSVVYSWGLGENGRLGLDVSVSTRGVACTAVPRPTFGSLYRVSNISCRGWTTLLVAEKILSQTTLRPNTAGTIGFDFLYGTSRKGNSPASPAEILVVDAEKSEVVPTDDSVTLQNSGVTPIWLRAEFEDADFIPLDAEGKLETVNRAKSPVPVLSLDQTAAATVELQEKVKTLEEKNTTLISQLQEKDALIEALLKQLNEQKN